MRKYNVIILFILLLVSFIIAGCDKEPPTKYIKDVEEGEVYQGGDPMSKRSIVDSQGNILYSKDLSQPGGVLRELFIKDDKLFNTPTIGQFVRDKGAKISGERDPSDYYPVNIKDLLSQNNIFNGEYWMINEGLSNLKQLERENLRLSQVRKSIGDKDKEFFIEEERLCVQGGNTISNMLYYRSENSGCYGNGNADCRPYFAEFPFFKSCSSLTNLKNTFVVPDEWNNYSISCNFNSNFATIPSFLKDVNVGFSHCLLKNNINSNNSILIGYGVGNPQLESNISTLKLELNSFFESFTTNVENLGASEVKIKNYEQKVEILGKSIEDERIFPNTFPNTIGCGGEGVASTPCSETNNVTVKNTTQKVENLENQFSGTGFLGIKSPITDEIIQKIIEDRKENDSFLLLSEPLRGTLHINSYQDKVSNNYMLFESIDEKIIEIKEYKVNLENSKEYYVYVDDYSSWYAISTNQLDMNDFYNSYEKTNQSPSRTAERLLIQKVQNDKEYILTEESETLYYKSNHLFNIDSDNSYTTFPIYLLQIEGVEEDACENYFGNYDYNSDLLEYGDSLMCRVESSTLVAHLSEKAFSQEYSENNEIGLGYLVMRNILYPN